ncbi:acetyl-CoA carboxylase biotin carboxylase subunit [Halalkalibacter akibai]|uniref:biotin carboxylase n=1 Tax=Halalkalibacter akibai (strain ATCC 43226 / DSM 21942 / CIP 109018 / JCM 9157 / 1139) TaxID=1236973 RepID=W4QVJ1_HALA3|nr:acetyl-CoA carboxylase biotin carboxylase subunit [Halalkalibacter akibai]GAE35648.1 biotin carboxylase of methylcrotonyl-CoA carboxylase [Halalkalibacter akibai JCM 9157]
MFKRILIANRGEIALRIIRTCKRLNIETIAIYSEADKEALHVKEADSSYCVGPPKVNESYLNINKIIEIAKDSKADAIHPGYGLLSENAPFAKRCHDEGIIFVGPSVEMIELMGEKIAARKAMKTAGFPIIPGTEKPINEESELVQAAEKIGFPLMLKASAGGGGIGMQMVETKEQLLKAVTGVRKRAEMFFGNGEIFLEKAVQNARHIEVQLLADHHGHIIHLWERDCSVQRRHQKVVEESPSPFLNDELRNRLGEMAVTAAKKLGYTNAGTIECLIDKDHNIYFLEMNTRLQVEHPVTEEITGLDLVEWQLRIAAGEQLAIQQEEVKRDGHAIEVRVYAEDPNTFFPSPGVINEITQPFGSKIRHECAVEAGSKVTPYYDPMIAKLIVKGQTRLEALKTLKGALNTYQIEGIKTNLPMLRKVIDHPVFQAGGATTSFVEEHYKKG